MAGNTKMNENERGIFSLIHGISGYLVAVALLLSILVVLAYYAIDVQQKNATTYYKVNKDLHGLKFNDPNNQSMRTIVK